MHGCTSSLFRTALLKKHTPKKFYFEAQGCRETALHERRSSPADRDPRSTRWLPVCPSSGKQRTHKCFVQGNDSLPLITQESTKSRCVHLFCSATRSHPSCIFSELLVLLLPCLLGRKTKNSSTFDQQPHRSGTIGLSEIYSSRAVAGINTQPDCRHDLQTR